jgi:hypothetical protein
MDSSEAIPATQPLKGPFTRWRAAAIHLAISAAIAAVVLGFMLVVWYPPPLFLAMGGVGLALILVGVDVVLGPTLTLVVFRVGKPGLKFDLAAIGACQIAALIYGCYVISLARPAFIVFIKDQFQVATVTQLAPEQLAKARYPQFRSPSWTGPVLAFGEIPQDHAKQQELIFLALSGMDLHMFPEYYAPYEDNRAAILRGAWPLSRMRKEEPTVTRVVDEWLAASGANEQNLRYVALRGRISWVAVLIDATTAEPVKMLLTDKI